MKEFDVTLLLRSRSGLVHELVSEHAELLPHERRYLSRREIRELCGHSKDDEEVVRCYAKRTGLQLASVNAGRRQIVLRGSSEQLCSAFGTKLWSHTSNGVALCGLTGRPRLPDELTHLVTSIIGFDDNLQAFPQVNEPHLPPMQGATSGPFYPTQIGELYDFPPSVQTRQQSIGIIALNTHSGHQGQLFGGFRREDIDTYAAHLRLATPEIVEVCASGATNRPGTSWICDHELTMNLQIIASLAPNSKIVVYFAPNTPSGFVDAVASAVHDQDNEPTVLSISWGAPEPFWNDQTRLAINSLFEDAAAIGMTVCASVGNTARGSADGKGASTHVHFPASSPFALACGGSTLNLHHPEDIGLESVWSQQDGRATAGGCSQAFDRPKWQLDPVVADGRRWIPDVAAHCNTSTGYLVLVNHRSFVLGGTSVTAPLWAGLISIINQHLPKTVGFLNPLLYGRLRGMNCFNDIVHGRTGEYIAAAGWDPCTGWGSPRGKRLLDALNGSLLRQD